MKAKQVILHTLLAGFVASATQAAFPQMNRTPSGKPAFSGRALPLTKFYDTPNPLPEGEPGKLIRTQEFDAYDLPLHVLAVRFLYHSRSATGQDVAVSGVVLYPDAKPPVGGWPVLVWAHAPDSVARQCAPSLTRNLVYGPALSMYVNLGYAVVLTDYAGLGTRFRNASSDLPSNATDLIHSMTAARATVSQLGTRWIAIGIGQGGSVVVEADELEQEIRDPNYLGSIAISGSEGSYDAPETVVPAHLLFLIYGIKSVYPDFDEKDVLTGKGLALYSQLEASCAEPGTPGAPWSEWLKSGWAENKYLKMYIRRNTLGQRRGQGPILVIDFGLRRQPTIRVINRLCEQGDRVEFERYARSDASSVFGDSVRDQIAWIQARFAGRPTITTCDEHR
jgi:hypothetical protein